MRVPNEIIWRGARMLFRLDSQSGMWQYAHTVRPRG